MRQARGPFMDEYGDIQVLMMVDCAPFQRIEPLWASIDRPASDAEPASDRPR